MKINHQDAVQKMPNYNILKYPDFGNGLAQCCYCDEVITTEDRITLVGNLGTTAHAVCFEVKKLAVFESFLNGAKK